MAYKKITNSLKKIEKSCENLLTSFFIYGIIYLNKRVATYRKPNKCSEKEDIMKVNYKQFLVLVNDFVEKGSGELVVNINDKKCAINKVDVVIKRRYNAELMAEFIEMSINGLYVYQEVIKASNVYRVENDIYIVFSAVNAMINTLT